MEWHCQQLRIDGTCIVMQRAFTIVELLIVVVVIAILASITVVAFNGVQARSQSSRIQADLAQLDKAIRAAQVNTGQNLLTQTLALGGNSTGAGRQCWGQASGTDLAALPKTHQCWTDYTTTLDIISTNSGANVRNLVDPWGRPYFIDQNEGEYVNPCQTPDYISAYRQPFVTGSGNYDANYLRRMPFVANC